MCFSLYLSISLSVCLFVCFSMCFSRCLSHYLLLSLCVSAVSLSLYLYAPLCLRHFRSLSISYLTLISLPPHPRHPLLLLVRILPCLLRLMYFGFPSRFIELTAFVQSVYTVLPYWIVCMACTVSSLDFHHLIITKIFSLH